MNDALLRGMASKYLLSYSTSTLFILIDLQLRKKLKMQFSSTYRNNIISLR